MRELQVTTMALIGLLGIGCGDTPDPGDDAGPARDGSAPGADAGPPMGVDAGPPGGDAGPPGADGGPPDESCTPTPGGAMGGAYCDLFHLSLVDDGSGDVEARLSGRVHPDGLPDEGCAVIDEVEVQQGGVAIGTLAGIGDYSRAGNGAPIARGPALPEMTTICGGDEDRFGGFGFIVRGRMDGGSFEAACADAEGGGRWPPALVITCHENVDQRPVSTYAGVDTFSGMTFTQLDVSVPHGPGGALTSVDSTVHVIGHADTIFGGEPAPPPFDITGLDTSVSESEAPAWGTYSSLLLSVMGDPLGTALCPEGWSGTGPEPPPAPVMILRLSGNGERGPFVTEAYVDMCTRTPIGP